MSNHTDPFRDACSAAFCLRATAELGEEGIVSSELLAMALPCQSCCYSCCCWQLCLWQLLPSPTVCPHSQPILQPSQKKLQNQELCGLPPDQTPALLHPRIPGLLIALCWSIGSSASISWIRLFLWLNSSNFESFNFLKALAKTEKSKRVKEP